MFEIVGLASDGVGRGLDFVSVVVPTNDTSTMQRLRFPLFFYARHNGGHELEQTVEEGHAIMACRLMYAGPTPI